jgi:hypothetical protein
LRHRGVEELHGAFERRAASERLVREDRPVRDVDDRLIDDRHARLQSA